MKSPLISIGELVHASIPKTGKIMAALQGQGENWDTQPCPELEYIKNLIETQVADGADYIAVNIDQFGESDSQLAVELMKKYVALVSKYSSGVPVCVDSSNDDVLIAGLRQWYDCNADAKTPLVNSIKTYTIENLMPLKQQYDFKFIGLLVSEDNTTSLSAKTCVDELFDLADKIFTAAVEKYGFEPDDIFFDSTVFPLAIDMPMMPDTASYAYRTFNTIKRIKETPKMKGCHFSLGITNSVRDLPARKIGVARAYVQVAMEYGLDAGIVNPGHKFGTKPADEEMVKLVKAYAEMDGTPEKLNTAMQLMGEFCSQNRKSV